MRKKIQVFQIPEFQSNDFATIKRRIIIEAPDYD